MANNLVNVRNGNQVVTLTDEIVINKVEEFVKDINLPESYNYKSAIKSFCLSLPDVKDIETASLRSVLMTAQQYVNNKLDIAKNQCALIVYKGTLKLQKMYFGNVALAKKSDSDIVRITSSAIYDGDDIEIEKVDGRTIVHHKTNFENMSKNIIGAYATAFYKDGTTNSEIMPISMLEQSWSMARNGTSVHKKFPAQMARKTVLNKLCIDIINTSTQSNEEDYIQDEVDREMNNENSNGVNFNRDDSDVIDIDSYSETNTSVEEKSEENDGGLPKEVQEEVKAKREEMLKKIEEENQKQVNEDKEVEEVLKRFEGIKQEEKEEPKEKVVDNNHCVKCGKQLPESSVTFYNQHPNMTRLCYKCNNEMEE